MACYYCGKSDTFKCDLVYPYQCGRSICASHAVDEFSDGPPMPPQFHCICRLHRENGDVSAIIGPMQPTQPAPPIQSAQSVQPAPQPVQETLPGLTHSPATVHPYFVGRSLPPEVHTDAALMARFTARTWSVPALCASYSFPVAPALLPGGGIIAIIELGGGWAEADMTAYFASINQPVPTIIDISIDGTVNSAQSPRNDADVEVALDILVAAAAYFCATGHPATIHIYWSQDIATAVARAAADGCSTCSISWGADEAEWGPAALNTMESTALAATTQSGMTIFAASGDNDSSDGGPTPANVDAPASCPHVIGCGGTTRYTGPPVTETVWNDNPGKTNGEGTGGGFSAHFPVQAWQIGAPKPPAPAPTRPTHGHPGPAPTTVLGRLVPDVAANADPVTGYVITVYGQSEVVGGTSAVAPLYAGFFAALGRKLGFISPVLWSVKGQACFNDITTGGNGDYQAGRGPDACSGIGSLNGVKVAALLAGAGKPV